MPSNRIKPPIDEAARAAKQAERALRRAVSGTERSILPSPEIAHRPRTRAHATIPVGLAIKEMIDKLENQSDREAAIVGASLMETMLEGALRTKIGKKNANVITHAFKNGALDSFSKRVSIAYLFGLIPMKLRCDFQNIGDIRNAFAHDFDDHSFEEEGEVFNLCKGLKLPVEFNEIAKQVLELNGKTLSDDGLPNVFSVTTSLSEIIASVETSGSGLTTQKKRFLATIRMAWVLLVGIIEWDLVGWDFRQPQPSL